MNKYRQNCRGVPAFAFPVPATPAYTSDSQGQLKMYNINVKNTYGIGLQAIAPSQYESKLFHHFFLLRLSENTISIVGVGYITASEETNDNGSCE
jgi:hypothetical protein